MATIIQPLHWDLQPEIQQAHRTTHTWTTTRCRTQKGNRVRAERPPHTHTRYPLHRLQLLYLHGKTQGFVLRLQHSCSHYNAFCSITWLTRISLRTWKQNMATIIQPLHWDLQPEIQQAHRTTHTWTTTRCRTQKLPKLGHHFPLSPLP